MVARDIFKSFPGHFEPNFENVVRTKRGKLSGVSWGSTQLLVVYIIRNNK